jgi:oxalate decarboxylase/phosphoglucose isomerase-like protein (cupin superfamily)
MEKIDLKVSFKDRRGKITDLLSKEKINAVTIITFIKGAARGNHCHKRTTQWNYLLSGKMKFFCQKPGGKLVTFTAKKGDFIVAGPNEKHTLKAVENSELLVLTKGPRGGKEYESDTFRLSEPLVK